MQDELKSLRQLKALQRYRILQQEKAEINHTRACHISHEARKSLQHEHDSYLKIIQHYTNEFKIGTYLNPTLQQPRLASIMQASQQLDLQRQLFEQKQQECHHALSYLVKSKSKVDVVVNAIQHLELRVAAQHQYQELADIFDAQRRKEVYRDI